LLKSSFEDILKVVCLTIKSQTFAISKHWLTSAEFLSAELLQKFTVRRAYQ
jgi:hypothetical protein